MSYCDQCLIENAEMRRTKGYCLSYLGKPINCPRHCPRPDLQTRPYWPHTRPPPMPVIREGVRCPQCDTDPAMWTRSYRGRLGNCAIHRESTAPSPAAAPSPDYASCIVS